MKVLKKLAWLATGAAVFLQLYIYTYPSLDAENCYWSHEYRDTSGLSTIEETILKLPYFGDLYKNYFIADIGYDINVQSRPNDIRMMAIGDPQLNGNWPNTPYLKRLDNYGNDYYLGHIFDVMSKRLDPTFVAMMGDLVSSQWTGDSEFYNRTRRILQRSFKRPIDQYIAELEFIEKHEDADWFSFLENFDANLNSGFFKTDEAYAHENVYNWNNGTSKPLFLNVTGNHDIGYGDTTYQHLARWKKLYGDVNYWIEYDSDTDHPWRIVMLNTLSIDGPMLQPQFQEYTLQFIEVLKQRKYTGSTILLTHVPMYKRTGLCKDGPNFEYYQASGCHGCSPDRVGLLKSQNHLSLESTRAVLDAIFGDGNGGIILTGHDHYGCDNYYNFIDEDDGWVASKSIDSEKWIREITVRSIMGDYGGTVGIMTGHFNETNKKWDFDYTQCVLGVQHIWWAAQVSTLFALLFHSISIFI
jgi:hypothetical protein